MEQEEVQLTTEVRPEEPATEAIEGEAKGEDDAEIAAENDAPKIEATKFEFNLDEEPKKKKKPKKSKKGKNKQKTFSREHYETLIASLNKQLADLRKIFTHKDKVNLELASELGNIEEERFNVCEYLERTLRKREVQLVELEQTLLKLQQEYSDYKETSSQRIDELQKLFVSVEKQLKGEIKLQERALSSLDEFRLRRNAALDRYQTTHDQVGDMERQCKEDLYNLEQKNTVQKNVLKKEVKMRLKQVAEDFLRSSEIRNAGYTRNLIRENITLHKTLERRVKQNISIMEEREKQFLKTKEVMESYSSLEQFTEHLEHTIENKEAIIKRLTDRIERMKTNFINSQRYRNLYDKAMQKGLFNRAAPKNLSDMKTHLEQLRAKKFALQWQTYQQEPEIERLCEVLDKLMSAVVMAANALNIEDIQSVSAMSESDIYELQLVLRQNIVSELIPIVSGNTAGIEESLDKQPHHSAIYRPGLCGFIPARNHDSGNTLTELFDSSKGEVRAAAEDFNVSTSLYGLEFGSCCYYSHTPTVVSSSMLEECTEEANTSIESGTRASKIGLKYKRRRCSCPKKKDSKDLERPTEIFLKAPRESHSLFNQCFHHQSANCFGLDWHSCCSECNSAQDLKLSKSPKTVVSFLSVSL